MDCVFRILGIALGLGLVVLSVWLDVSGNSHYKLAFAALAIVGGLFACAVYWAFKK